MLGKQERNTSLFQCVTMEQLVPERHVLRRLNAVLDLSFVREKVAPLYSHLGRHSFDPEVVVRIWFLQHFYGYAEREVCDEITMHAGFRWFCGLSFNDPVPDQSTLVKLRTEKWAATDLWQAVLDETVRACEAAGLTRPGDKQRLGVDGTQITANAATASLEAFPAAEPPPNSGAEPGGAGEGAAAPAEAAEATPSARRSGDPDWHGERFSNATHRSTTDPEARLYRKSAGQETKLRYLGHYLADVRSGVIYGALATQATGMAEREAALTLLDRLPQRPGELAADLGYRDGKFLAALLARGIQPLVPLGAEPLEEGPQYRRRTYNLLHFRQRKAAQAEAAARNATRLAARTRAGKQAQRQRTRLEHLFGEAKEHHGLGRARGRGLERVDQQVKLTAAVQNLKRLLRRRSPARAAATQVAGRGNFLRVVGNSQDRQIAFQEAHLGPLWPCQRRFCRSFASPRRRSARHRPEVTRSQEIGPSCPKTFRCQRISHSSSRF